MQIIVLLFERSTSGIGTHSGGALLRLPTRLQPSGVGSGQRSLDGFPTRLRPGEDLAVWVSFAREGISEVRDGGERYFYPASGSSGVPKALWCERVRCARMIDAVEADATPVERLETGRRSDFSLRTASSASRSHFTRGQPWAT